MPSLLNQPHFQNAESARHFLEAVRWPNGPVCPHCGSVSPDHYRLEGKAHRPGLLKCKDCREQFSVTVGTVFERSKISLNVWLQAVHLICSSKKGMSSHQLHRTLGVTYKTAWFMTHRIRESFKAGSFVPPMGGSGKIVEADETYWGTEEGKDKKQRSRKGGAAHKVMNKIVALVERDGNVRAFHVPDVTGPNLKAVLTSQIHADTHVMTDSSPRYNLVKREPPFSRYSQINHNSKVYVDGIVHTNTVEGFFSLLKRGLIGTFHHVSSHHLQRYMHEFEFRYNYRTSQGYTDEQRAEALLSRIGGKRLTYRRIKGQNAEGRVTPTTH